MDRILQIFILLPNKNKVETDNSRQDDEQPLPILKSEVIHAIKNLKNGKSPRELLKGGGEAK